MPHSDQPDQYERMPSGTEKSGNATFADALKALDPAYFGFIMSTGILSIAFHELGIDTVAWSLTILNISWYILFVGLFGIRTVLYPNRVVADLRDSERHWGTLTFIVATNTVGIELLSFFDAVVAATALWFTMVIITPVLLYYLFMTEIIGVRKVSVSERINGAFLLVIVCMQSLAILGVMLSDELEGFIDEIILLSMSYFGAAYILYFVVITVVTYRLFDGAVRPDDWTGPYWITMGAAAITTLAGATLGPQLESMPAWESYAPVILGVTFLAWAIASWWIPLLLAFDIWKLLTGGTDDQPPLWIIAVPWSRLAFGRHLHTYNPAAWGRVFPMGMYTACTLNLAGISTFTALRIIPVYWGWFSLFIWVLTVIGMCRAVGNVVLSTSSQMADTNRSA